MIQKFLIGQFGQLKEKEIRLDPHINVLYGKNESGKTTLCSFLKAMLYGFSPSRKADVQENERARYTPWNNEIMQGTMELSLENGPTVLIERIFKDSIGKSGAKVSDAVTGEELFYLEPNPGATCFGVSLSTFEKTAFIGQNDYKIEKDEEITNRLSNLMSTMEEEVSAQLAKKKLDGLRKYYFTTHGSGIINDIKKEIEQLHQDLSAAQEDRVLYETLAEKKEQLQKELERAQTRLDMLKLQQKEAAARVVQKEFQQITQADEDLTAQNNRLQEIYGMISNENGTADQEFIAIVRDGLAKSTSRSLLGEEQKQRLQKYLQDEQEIYEKMGQFGQGRILMAEEDKKYQRLESEVTLLNQKIEGVYQQTQKKEEVKAELEKMNNPAFAKYETLTVEQLRERVSQCGLEEGALGKRKSPAASVGLFVFATLCSILAAGLYMYAQQLLLSMITFAVSGIGIVAGIITLIWHYRKLAQRKRALDRILKEFSVDSARQLREMAEQYEEYSQRKAELIKKEEQLDFQIELSNFGQLEQEKKERTEQMGLLLRSAQCETIQQLEQRCEKMRGLIRQKEAVSVAIAQIKEDYEKCTTQAQLASQETLQYAWRIFPAAASSEELEHMIPKVEDLIREVDRLKFSIEALKEKKRQILRDRTVDEMRQTAKTLEGKEPISPEELASLERNITDANEEYLQLTKQHVQLVSQCDTYVTRGAAVVGIEEQLAQKEQELAACQLRHSASIAAIEKIDEAFAQIQRTFAPKLNQLAGRYLAKITNEKYHTLFIDKNYEIRIGDQRGRTFEIGYFSAGTKDQIYLSVRLALLEMLEGAGEKMPLILDDAFSQFDDERLICALRSLSEIGKERQIILLTCHKREGAILNKLCGVVEQHL